MDINKKYELLVVLLVVKFILENGIDVVNLFKVVDFVNVMMYDLNGVWILNSVYYIVFYGNLKDLNYDSGFFVD